MANASRNIIIRFLGDTKDLDKSSRQGERSVGLLDRSTKRLAATVGGLVAGAQIVDFFRGAVSGASEAEQSIGAVDSVFKENAGTIHEWAQESAQNLGLSANAYRQLATVTGAQLKNMGVAQDEVAGKTDELITLGADLAATYGGTTSEAVEALGSLLRGETDPIERYGVSIKAADIAARQAEMGLDGLEGQAAKNAQTQALLALVTEQTADAQGQFAKESETAAGQAQRAQASWENFQQSVGELLLPALTQLAEVANEEIIPAMQAMVGWIQDNSDVIGEWAPRIGIAVGGVVALAAAVRGIQIMGSITRTALTPFTSGMERLDKSAPRAAGGVRNFGRVLGGVAGGLGVAVAAWELLNMTVDATPVATGEAEQALQSLGRGVDNDLIDRIIEANGELDKHDKWLGVIPKSLDGWTSSGRDSAKVNKQWAEDVGAMDAALAAMVGEGNLSGAAEYVRMLGEALGLSGDELGAFIDEHLPGYEDALAGARAATEESQAATEGHTGATGEFTDATGEATGAVQDNTDALLENLDVQFESANALLGLRGAENSFAAAVDDATEAVEENGATLDVNTEKGRANRSALDAIASSAHDVAREQLEAGASGDTMAASMRNARDAFIAAATQMGLSAEEAENLANELGLIPENITSTVGVQKSASFDRQIASIRASLNQAMTGTFYAGGVRYNRGQMAAGGNFSAGRTALVGEFGPEIVRFGSAGRVFPAAQTKQMLTADEPIEVNVAISREVIAGIAEVEIKRNGRAVKRAVGMGAQRAGAMT